MIKSKKPFAIILCFLAVLSFFILRSENRISAYQDRYIRIALYHDVSSLSSSGSKESIQVSALKGVSFGYYNGGTFIELYTNPSGERYTIKCDPSSSSGILLYNQAGEKLLSFNTSTGNFQARPRPENSPLLIRLGDYYRGFFEFRRFSYISPGYLTVINEVNVEDYLYGVVPKEMEAYESIEALKAQSVAARTYAYKHMESPKSPYGRIDCHLSDASDSQVYYGYAIVNKVNGSLIMVEQPSTNMAVNATKGQVLTYNGSYIWAYFSSSNGGYTEAPENVWSSSIPYLKAKPDYDELTTSSHYYWERTFTSSQLRQIILNDTNNKSDIGNVTRIEMLRMAPSGRPTQIRLTGSKGYHDLYNSECRTVFSLNGQLYDIVNNSSLQNVSVVNGYSPTPVSVSPSNLYALNASGVMVKVSKNSIINGSTVFKTFDNISTASDSFTFIGRGWGHAIGMSQEGAKGMAEKGHTYREILAFYYPNTVLK